jgi:hypothetical protein
MERIIDQQLMNYLNVFGQISRVRVNDCFMYNNKIIFAVPQKMLSMALGRNGENVKRANDVLLKRIRVVALPKSIADAGKFLSAIVYPIEFKSTEITPIEIVICASGVKNRAELMGRNKARMKELQNIAKQYFNKSLRIA